MVTLRTGSRGPYVQMLQLALLRAGFDSGSLDGIFGARVYAAVTAFQRANGLVQDGIVGMLTNARLHKYLTGYITHTVARGETFWQLASRYGTTVNAIRTANPGVNPMNLSVGASVVIPLGFPVVPTSIDYTYDLVSHIVEGLLARYPFIRGGSIGRSIMGNELYYMRIGNGTRSAMYNASHHANEWITTPVLLKYVEDIATAYAYNGTVYGQNMLSLLNEKSLYVVPLVNPDGVDLVTGGIATDSSFYTGAVAIAENYPNIPFTSGWKANIVGTDLNLSYPANWERAREIKFAQGYTQPAPRDYVGEAPLSAPESLAMYNFTLQNDFLLTLSYHTQGEVIYWKYADYEPENSLAIGQQLANASGYALELTPSESAYAGYKDWFIQTYNRPGYTVEVGRGTNPLPITQFDRIYADNIGLLTVALQNT